MGLEITDRYLSGALESLLESVMAPLTRPGVVHLFRGQGDATWPAVPTLYRRFINAGYDESEITEELISRHETDLFCEAHGAGFYLGNRLETMIRLQHFGGSTRLLDVTRDPFVALWFAVSSEHDDRDGNIVCYSADPAVVAMPGSISTWDDIAEKIPSGQAIVYFPGRDEERVKAQYAGFISATLKGGLDEGCAYTIGTDKIELQSIIIPAILKPVVREYLITSRGFSPYSLFPDFAGFAIANGAGRSFPRSAEMLYDGVDGLFPTGFEYPA